MPDYDKWRKQRDKEGQRDDSPITLFVILLLLGLMFAAILFYGLACNGQEAASFCF